MSSRSPRALLPILLLHWLSLPSCPGQVPPFLLSRKDIVDKSVDVAETVLSASDFENMPEKEVDLRRLGIWVEPDPTMGNKAEGDIAELPPKSKKLSKKDGAQQQLMLFDENGLARNSIRQPYRRWPQNEIPYALSSQYGAYSRSVIAKAMNEYHAKTCIRFVPRDARKHRDYVFIHPDDGCYSLVGRTGGLFLFGRQPLSLDSGCIQVGTIVHELMHAVGFFHEQSRYDRDQYIQILWANVLRGADDQFEKYSYNTIDQLGEPYDYGSIMHYGPYAFSANGRRTIVTRRSGAQKMGQRTAFSDIDLRKINKLYQCDQQQRGGSRTVESARGQQEEEGEEDCEDKNWRCIFWSMPVFQHCENLEAIREQICPLSCGTCKRPEKRKRQSAGVECADRSPLCTKHLCKGTMGKLFCNRTCRQC